MRVLQLGDIQLLFYALELCKMCSLPYYKGCYLLISKGGYYRGYYKGLLFGQFLFVSAPFKMAYENVYKLLMHKKCMFNACMGLSWIA